jgi:hypothetical protein
MAAFAFDHTGAEELVMDAVPLPPPPPFLLFRQGAHDSPAIVDARDAIQSVVLARIALNYSEADSRAFAGFFSDVYSRLHRARAADENFNALAAFALNQNLSALQAAFPSPAPDAA